MLVVGRSEHLGLVDVVDAEALQHLRLDEMSDPGLGHHRDGHRVDDPSTMSGSLIRDTPPWARMSRHSLQGHDGDGTGVLGDLAWSRVTTSMITPPLSISAMPRLTRAVPICGVVACSDTLNL